MAVAGAALLAGGCGGGSSPSAPTPTSNPGLPAAAVVLDSGNFDALVLGATMPGLVEFQLPT